MPVLSRSCRVEKVSLMSLGNWEDEMDDEAEPEELPNYLRRVILRWT